VKLTTVELATFLGVLVRTAAWMHAAPIVGDKGLPPRLRIALAALFALAVTPLRPAITVEHLLVTAPAELLIGLGTGFAARLALAGAEAGGQLIGVNLELNFAGTLDPIAREETLPTRRVAWCLAGLAFIASGGIESSLRVLAWANADAPTLHQALVRLIAQGGQAIALGLRAAAPMMLAAVVANVAVALASRAAPALNVFSVMLATILVVGAIILIGTAPAYTRELTGDARLAGEAAAQLLGK
jgi:flagellar biosynthetic protein FliR